jgi:hypothetical protein
LQGPSAPKNIQSSSKDPILERAIGKGELELFWRRFLTRKDLVSFQSPEWSGWLRWRYGPEHIR